MWGFAALSRASAVAFSLASPVSRHAATRTMAANHAAIRSHATTANIVSTTQFVVRYEYIPDVLEKRAPYREEHLGLFKKMMEEGTCLSAGPTGPVAGGTPTGALFVFTSADAAKAFVAGDPYIPGGIVTEHTIEEWSAFVKE